MNGPSDRAVEAAAQTWEYHPLSEYDEETQGRARTEARKAVEAAFPIIRADLAKDPEFLTMIANAVVDDMRKEIVAEVVEAMERTNGYVHDDEGVWSPADFARRFDEDD